MINKILKIAQSDLKQVIRFIINNEGKLPETLTDEEFFMLKDYYISMLKEMGDAQEARQEIAKKILEYFSS